MQIEVICYFCFEVFSADLEYFEGENIEIWDCEVCCNPNKIHYEIKNNIVLRLEVSSGND
jgi:hypothetical protein